MKRPIDLAPATWAALEQIASTEAVTLDRIICDAIDRDLYRRSRAKKAVRTDERLVAPLRALLAEDLAYADSWHDLEVRLKRKGYALVAAGAGLALHETSGRRLCKASDLGVSYGRLMRRFGAAMPNHPHRYLPQRLGVSPPSFR